MKQLIFTYFKIFIDNGFCIKKENGAKSALSCRSFSFENSTMRNCSPSRNDAWGPNKAISSGVPALYAEKSSQFVLKMTFGTAFIPVIPVSPEIDVHCEGAACSSTSFRHCAKG